MNMNMFECPDTLTLKMEQQNRGNTLEPCQDINETSILRELSG